VEPSHVLVAMGLPRELALGAIRFSFGRESTIEDVERAVEVVPTVVSKVRKLAGVLGRTGGTAEGRNDGTSLNRSDTPTGKAVTTDVPTYRRTAEGTR